MHTTPNTSTPLPQLTLHASPFELIRSMRSSLMARENCGHEFSLNNSLSCDERIRMLTQHMLMNKSSLTHRQCHRWRTGPELTLPNVSQSPAERRCQQRVHSRAKLAFFKECKAQLSNSLAHQQTRIGKQARRISFLTEPVPSCPSNVTSFQEEEEDSTIVMPVSYSEEEMFVCQDFGDIFDNESSVHQRYLQESREKTHVFEPMMTMRQTSQAVSHFRRQVSEASFGCGLRETPWQDRAISSARRPTPKESGFSSWDDVSSIATLSRLGGFEPEPLPMDDCPIPLVIFVPNEESMEEDLEPLRVFPTHNIFPFQRNLADRTGPGCTNLFQGTFASSSM